MCVTGVQTCALPISTRGVHYAPANVPLLGALDLTYNVSDGEQDLLNPIGINVIRSFQGEGIRPWGARTLTSYKDGRHYVNVRRLLNYVKESLRRGLRFAIFELNEQRTWQTVQQTCAEFLNTMFERGMLFSPDGTRLACGGQDGGRAILAFALVGSRTMIHG